jgi:uracil-DNA glycosylase
MAELRSPFDADITENELTAMLEWQIAAGVDLAISETPIDQFAALRNAKAPSTSPAQAPDAVSTSAAPEGNPAEAEALAKTANTLEELRAIMAAFDGLTLKARATQLVFADGNAAAKIMLVGEAPGREEDLEGIPFAGRSGELLDRMLAAIGLDRKSVYLANVVGWRPPGSRPPSPAETEVCLPFLRRQIELVAPQLLLTLGAPAAQSLLGSRSSINKLRGDWRELKIGETAIKILPTFHPEFLLRQPAQKKLAWQDLLLFRRTAKELGLL